MANTLALLVESGGDALAVSSGGVDFFWMPGAEDGAGAVVSYRRKKHYTRKDDLIEIYAANPQDAPVNDPVIRTPKAIKPAQKPVEAKPEQTIKLVDIEALAREQDAMQSYEKAMKRRDWERLAKLYERLIDEQDVEILLMYA